MKWFNKYFENNCFIFHKWNKWKVATRNVIEVVNGRQYKAVETYQYRECYKCYKCGKYEYEAID